MKNNQNNIHKTAIFGYEPHRNIGEDNFQPKVGFGLLMMSGSIIYNGTIIGNNCKIGHNAIIREQNEIGDNFSLWSNSIIDYGCIVGDNVKIHTNVYVAQFTRIENDVFLAPGVTIGNDPHPGCKFSTKCMRGPHILSGARIGLNVTILPFVTIGSQALIGAGSVVTKDIPDGMLAFGNPARVIKPVWELTCEVSPPFIDHPYKKKEI